MLNDHPRQQLKIIIENYGKVIVDDPRRVRGMLKDLAPKNTLETNLLIQILEQKLVAELMAPTQIPLPMYLDSLAKRLHNNMGTQKEYADWAIESWALALGVIQQPLVQQTITPEPAPIPSVAKPQPPIIVPPKPAPITSTTQEKIGRFIVQDGIATDTETGLTWLRFSYGQRWEHGRVVGDAKKLKWEDAMKVPNDFNKIGYAGYHDWRVPNIDELMTLIDKTKGEKRYYIDLDVFPRSEFWYWSSSPYAYASDGAWLVNFRYGHSDFSSKGNDYYVRLVR